MYQSQLFLAAPPTEIPISIKEPVIVFGNAPINTSDGLIQVVDKAIYPVVSHGLIKIRSVNKVVTAEHKRLKRFKK